MPPDATEGAVFPTGARAFFDSHIAVGMVPAEPSPLSDTVARVPSSAGETFYDLAVRALAEQEGQVSSLRTRTGTLVAGAAVVATLLAKTVFEGSHPDGVGEWLAAATGLVGMALLLISAIYLLRSHDVAFALDVRETYAEAEARGELDDAADIGALHAQLAFTMADRHAENAPTVLAMRDFFALALTGLLAEIVGLGIAAALA